MNHTTIMNQINAAFKAQDRAKTVSLIATLLDQNASLGSNWTSIAHISAAMGENSLAIKAAHMLASNDSQNLALQIQAAAIMAQAGRVPMAYDFIKVQLIHHGKDPSLNHFIGTLQSQLGNLEDSLASLRCTLRVWKTAGVTWMTLAALKKFTKDDEDLKNMLAVQNDVKSSKADNYAAYLYAAAKALADIGDVDQSFKLYKKAADIMRKQQPFDMSAELRYVNSLIRGFSSQAIASLEPSNVESDVPIFIVGYPRSGTTLVEQILTSHKDICDGGEINLFRTAALPMKGFTMQHAQAYEAGFTDKTAAWKTIADTYLHLLQERFDGDGRMVDKSLANSKYIGLIKHIFPNSPIIWMRRNPVDSAWSCYKTFFASSLDWTWSLKDIATSFKIEDQLREHWTSLYPDAILEVPYEELVSDSEVWIAKILKHCNLDNDNAVYKFHETKRPVLTSSVAQVRGPMTKTSIGAAEPYKEHLKAFIDTYDNKDN